MNTIATICLLVLCIFGHSSAQCIMEYTTTTPVTNRTTADTTIADTTIADTTIADTTIADTTIADTTTVDTTTADAIPIPAAPAVRAVAPDFLCKHTGPGYFKSNVFGKYFYCFCSVEHSIWLKHILQCPVANNIQLEFDEKQCKCV